MSVTSLNPPYKQWIRSSSVQDRFPVSRHLLAHVWEPTEALDCEVIVLRAVVPAHGPCLSRALRWRFGLEIRKQRILDFTASPCCKSSEIVDVDGLSYEMHASVDEQEIAAARMKG